MCKMFPEITIIVPIYNVEKYLQQCIDSLLAQTMMEIEIIFVNDASPDNSREIVLENLSKFQGRAQLIDAPYNMKQGAARNLGIKNATGKYVGFVDPDDFIAPNMYEQLHKMITSNDCDAAFIQYTSVANTAVYLEELEKTHQPIIRWKTFLIDNQKQKLEKEQIEEFLTIPIGGVFCGIYKRELIEQNCVYFPEKMRYEDNYWGSMMRCYIRNYVLIEKIGYYYRQNPHSTMHTLNPSYIFDRNVIEDLLISAAKERDVFYEYYEAWEYLYIERFFYSTFMLYSAKFEQLDFSYLSGLIKKLNDQFPNWKKNTFYRRDISPKDKMVIQFAYNAPQLTARMINILAKTKRTVNAIYNKYYLEREKKNV